jgi:hypothetical protein
MQINEAERHKGAMALRRHFRTEMPVRPLEGEASPISKEFWGRQGMSNQELKEAGIE